MPTFPAAFRNLAGEGQFFEKNRINPAVFRMFSISSQPISCWLRGFLIFRQFSVSFRIFHFLPIHKIRKRGYQIQQIQFAMQKAASNTRKTITVSHSAIRHFSCQAAQPCHGCYRRYQCGINSFDSWGGSYGHCIQIDHGGGLETLYSRYADKLYRWLCPLLYAGGHA